MRDLTVYLGSSLLLVALLAACNRAETSRSLSKESLTELSTTLLPNFVLAEGFELELFAAEPLIKDPVAMEIDERGRIYVVEMPGYPLDVSGSGKVIQLIDSDQDGFPDRSRVFADGLALPTGIMRWKEGFLVTDAPDVLYLEDQDGDGRADVREVVLTGFARSNPQHNVNSPVWGLDNNIYLANEYYITTQQHADILGDKGSPIIFPKLPNSPQLPPNGDDRSIKFNPDTHLLENTSSRSQYGHTFDPWGRYFQTSNASHLHHEVISANYLQRKPHLLVADAQQYVPTYGHPIEVFPITRQPDYQLLTDIGTITSACAIHWYKGHTFPDSFHQVVFTAEPTHNLIHADKMQQQGASFISTPLTPKEEFLRSFDPWFRPVCIYQGPDEALYILDYYRKIIEHPEWMATEVNESGELYQGSQKGRIYRLIPKSTAGKSPPKFPNISLGEKAETEWVNYLFHPNIWYRQHAQRLLVDTKSAKLAEQIKVQLSQPIEGPGYVHALWALQGLGALSIETLRPALRAQEAGVRENALKLLEFYPDSLAGMLPELVELGQDPDERVRFQLMCTIGAIPDGQDLILSTLFDNLQNPWITLAAFTSPVLEEEEMFQWAQEKLGKEDQILHSQFYEMLGASWAAKPELSGLSGALGQAFSQKNAPWKAAFFAGIHSTLQHKQKGIKKLELHFEDFLMGSLDPSPEVRRACRNMVSLFPPASEERLRPILYRAESIIGDKGEVEGLRADAISLLATIFPERYDETFFAYLKSTEPPLLQLAAVKGLGKLPNNRGCQFLLENWSSITPPIRSSSIDEFMSSQPRMKMLLKAIEDSVVQASTLGWPRTVRLMNHDDTELKQYARRILAPKEEMGEDIIANYQAELPQGEAELGQSIYQQHCQSCHTYAGKGPIVYGPDLATLRNREAHSLLLDILYPNRSIADGYEIWNCTLRNGKQLAGIIDRENANSLILKMANGSEQIIPRNEVESLEAIPHSGMPVGLNGQISPKEMADLISFIKWGNYTAVNDH